jgi:hypothetical protein
MVVSNSILVYIGFFETKLTNKKYVLLQACFCLDTLGGVQLFYGLFQIVYLFTKDFLR